MYQPYPTSGQEPVPQRPEPPRSIQTAVKLMYAGAALSLAGLIIDIATVHSLRHAILVRFPKYTASQVHAAEVVTIAGEALGGLIAIGLWLWMARANGAGRNYARIMSSVLFAIATIELLATLARPHSVLALLFGVLVWLVGLGAIAAIWQRDSSAYYQSS